MAKTKRPDNEEEIVGYWLKEIGASRKREKDYRKEGKRILDIYSGKKKTTTPFNILYSNTETLLPALYSSVPRPVVQRRFKDEDPIGKHAAVAGERILEFLLDTNVDGYETFDEGMRCSTLDGLLPGRGVLTVKYDAEVSEVMEGEETLPVKNYELVCVETKPWERVYFGYAKKWSQVPWIAYEEYIDRKEAVRLFGEEMASKLIFTEGEEQEHDEKDNHKDPEMMGSRKTCLVYQIWDKDGGKDGKKKIRYVSPQYKDGYLKVEDDPLELTGFFNMPKPLMFLEQSGDMTPVAIYSLYENQAKELNRLTVRINKIVEAIKARGVYDTELGEDLSNLMNADDNALVPADKSSSIAAEKGLQNAIWFMPVEQLVNVLRELYVAREQCKQVIYEITGIADILRGSSKASETLGAQEIKERWGSLRLKRLQKEIQRFARDILRMMLEVSAFKFSEETWARMTGLPFVTTEQKQQLLLIAQAAQMSGQPLDEQTQMKLQSPAWGDILKVLQDDMQRAYRIDVETNSTVEPEAVEDQKNIAEVMTALGQYMNGITPLVTSGAMPFQAAQSMMLAITRRFRFGNEIEDYIKQMQAPKPPDDGKEAEAQKMQMEQQSKQAEMQQRQAELQATHQREQEKSIQQSQLEQERVQFEREKFLREEALEREKIESQERIEIARLAQEKENKLAELQAERATARMKAEIDQKTELMKAEIQAKAQADVARTNASQKTEAETRNSSNEKDSASMHKEMMAMMQAMMEAMSKPKGRIDIVRDRNGMASSLVPN